VSGSRETAPGILPAPPGGLPRGGDRRDSGLPASPTADRRRPRREAEADAGTR
jgi:hypothetical protein